MTMTAVMGFLGRSDSLIPEFHSVRLQLKGLNQLFPKRAHLGHLQAKLAGRQAVVRTKLEAYEVPPPCACRSSLDDPSEE